MKVAVTYNQGMIAQHFEHAEAFKLYEVVDDAVVKAQVVDTNGGDHGALADFLTAQGVEILLCGEIDGAAQMAVASAGIKLYGSIAGYADDAVTALLAGELRHDPDNPHCGSHSCH